MNMNFVRKPKGYTEELFSELKIRPTELKNQEIIKMLNDSWRPSKVGAWMIGELKTSEHILKMYESNYYIETIKESLNRLKN